MSPCLMGTGGLLPLPPYTRIVSGDSRNLRLIRLTECRHQTSDGVLELAVLDGVDERIDTAVGEHQYHGDVVEPSELHH